MKTLTEDGGGSQEGPGGRGQAPRLLRRGVRREREADAREEQRDQGSRGIDREERGDNEDAHGGDGCPEGLDRGNAKADEEGERGPGAREQGVPDRRRGPGGDAADPREGLEALGILLQEGAPAGPRGPRPGRGRAAAAGDGRVQEERWLERCDDDDRERDQGGRDRG